MMPFLKGFKLEVKHTYMSIKHPVKAVYSFDMCHVGHYLFQIWNPLVSSIRIVLLLPLTVRFLSLSIMDAWAECSLWAGGHYSAHLRCLAASSK